MTGDVETNPGPSYTSDADPSSNILAAFTALQSGQATILEKLGSIKSTLADHEKLFADLNTRLAKIEFDFQSISNMKSQIENIQSSATNCSAQVCTLTARIDDLENVSRRSKLVFYGLKDVQNESWSDAENLVIGRCQDNLNITLQSNNIERAHRLGTFNEGKHRPIIVEFLHFKDKERIICP